MNFEGLATKSAQGQALSRDECYSLLRTPETEILQLIHAAFKIRQAHFGRKVHLCAIVNAKSGLCSEDCAYCAQSSISVAPIDKYPLIDQDKLVEEARSAKSAKATRYGIVSSGRAPTEREVDQLCEAIVRIKREVDIGICASLGFLTESTAAALKEAGVDRYNHNLNASEGHYSKICSTHGYQDRIETNQIARNAGLELCCGALFGMGETDADVVDLCLALREIGPNSIPVNFLHPIEGTRLEEMEPLTPITCLKILCLMRLVNPAVEIRAAGGREYCLRSLQPLALYPVNSIFVSGYLTTDGQRAGEAWQMIEDMGFEIEQDVADEVGVTL